MHDTSKWCRKGKFLPPASPIRMYGRERGTPFAHDVEVRRKIRSEQRGKRRCIRREKEWNSRREAEMHLFSSSSRSGSLYKGTEIREQGTFHSARQVDKIVFECVFFGHWPARLHDDDH